VTGNCAEGAQQGSRRRLSVTTDSNGVATSPVFPANATSGSYTVTATAAGVSIPANFSLTNKAAINTYGFYLSGQEAFGPDYYALAGAGKSIPVATTSPASKTTMMAALGWPLLSLRATKSLAEPWR